MFLAILLDVTSDVARVENTDFAKNSGGECICVTNFGDEYENSKRRFNKTTGNYRRLNYQVSVTSSSFEVTL